MVTALLPTSAACSGTGSVAQVEAAERPGMFVGETLHTALFLRERVPGKAVRTPSRAAGNRSARAVFGHVQGQRKG